MSDHPRHRERRGWENLFTILSRDPSSSQIGNKIKKQRRQLPAIDKAPDSRVPNSFWSRLRTGRTPLAGEAAEMVGFLGYLRLLPGFWNQTNLFWWVACEWIGITQIKIPWNTKWLWNEKGLSCSIGWVLETNGLLNFKVCSRADRRHFSVSSWDCFCLFCFCFCLCFWQPGISHRAAPLHLRKTPP